MLSVYAGSCGLVLPPGRAPIGFLTTKIRQKIVYTKIVEVLEHKSNKDLPRSAEINKDRALLFQICRDQQRSGATLSDLQRSTKIEGGN